MWIADFIKYMSVPKNDYTNAFVNGSFENDFAGWTTSTTIMISTVDKKHGNKSCAWAGVSANYKNVSQIALIPAGHKVYVSYWLNITSITQGSFYCKVEDGSTVVLEYLDPPYAVTGGWVQKSGIYTLANPNVKVTVGTSNFSGTVYLDAVTCIDLTEAFGAGNEPNKTWCDANITLDKIGW